ncbi:class I SAM-dependent DNA methyltransferase [Streptomyces xanthophaeus]|uniref:Methyltransferase n=1 Tax=Streptomyces xanthophaeus TaxID=67385 RepID=A0A919LC86_9ACTN|nr:class I SAM-dependent methyltransferase [Streptomyces xanthophaeus]WST26320.1 class I SAM-dependent methyltransferase [Streptomyces xanthophaeus]WST58706.1 class I SAM-dependent methyltransferase [Streptomyces xanthophaeus]GHI85460.1 methyltransferase [Streptomyces xanthophaeus]
MTETSRLTAVRASYDAVAVDYARLLGTELAGKPLDRSVLAAFAEYVRDGSGGGRAVADLGCGPGRVTAHLDALGVRAFGVDLSPAMVAVARRTYPGLRFEVGSMAALDVADGVLGGVLAWYSTVHTPPAELPPVFAEFARVLAPGGYALVAFKAGDEQLRLQYAYGHPVDLDVYRTPPDRIAALLAGAGLDEVARLVRGPAEDERSPQGFLLARKA